MSALSDLLNSQPVSARQAAELAENQGVRLPYGTIAAYWSGRHGKPSAATLSALAKVLPVSATELQKAAWGSPAPLGQYLPPEESHLLDERQRRAVDEVIRSIVAARADPAAELVSRVEAGIEQYTATHSGAVEIDWSNRDLMLVAQFRAGGLVVHVRDIDEAAEVIGMPEVRRRAVRNPVWRSYLNYRTSDRKAVELTISDQGSGVEGSLAARPGDKSDPTQFVQDIPEEQS